MDCGIHISKTDTCWILGFNGDVRLSLCTTLDDLIEGIFDQIPSQLMVDLSTAQNIDSTCLGLLAKLAMRYQVETQRLPQLLCPDGDLSDLIESLGLETLFESVDALPVIDAQALPLKTCDAQSASPLVLQAHETLAELNQANQAQFQGLISALKSQS